MTRQKSNSLKNRQARNVYFGVARVLGILLTNVYDSFSVQEQQSFTINFFPLNSPYIRKFLFQISQLNLEHFFFHVTLLPVFSLSRFHQPNMASKLE